MGKAELANRIHLWEKRQRCLSAPATTKENAYFKGPRSGPVLSSARKAQFIGISGTRRSFVFALVAVSAGAFGGQRSGSAERLANATFRCLIGAKGIASRPLGKL